MFRYFIAGFFIVLAGCGFVGMSAVAQSYAEDGYKRLNLRLDDPSLILLGAEQDGPERKAHLIAAYYRICRGGNTIESLDPYNERQCACTAAQIDQNMDVDDLETMFETSDDGNYAYARMLFFSYLPCLSETLKDITEDQCVSDQPGLCECLVGKVERYVRMNGTILFSGFMRGQFDKKRAAADPLFMAVTHKNLELHKRSFIRQCTLDPLR